MKLKSELKPGTIADTMTVLIKIWKTVCTDNNLKLPDPFEDMYDFIPKKRNVKRLPKNVLPDYHVWRIGDAQKIIDNMVKHHVNATRLFFLTGLMASEIAGIRKQDVTEDILFIVNFIPRRSKGKNVGKNEHRIREIPMTKAIRACLDEAIRTAQDEYLFRTTEGNHFNCSNYYDNWVLAVKKAGLPHAKPYSTRHTFAAWSLAVGLTPNFVVDLMGHCSKEMVYEVYAKWTKNLQKDVAEIRHFMGDDFGV